MSEAISIDNATSQQLQRLLKDKRTALAQALGHRDEISVVRAADVIDAMQLSQERNIAVENLDLETHLLRQVDAALARMDEGTYGTCLHCEDQIPEKRLRALPWAILCLGCQERQERQNPRRSAVRFAEAA
jgi:DnaK suppressor protein